MPPSSNTLALPQPPLPTIDWLSLWTWLKKTTNADRKYYQPQNRPITPNRLWHLAFPNLKAPVFIIGSPRSGTTFLGSCIAALPEISYHFEPVATKAAARYIHTQEWNFARGQRFYKLVYSWLMRVHKDGDLRFADKTPRNCFVVDFLHQAFPDAQFIHIIRDGRDAALSHSKKPWMQAAQAQSRKSEPGGYRFGPYARFWVEPERTLEFEFTTDIHRCIWAWKRHTESALQAVTNLPQHQYHELRYEQLVTNPQEEAENLLNFLNITDSLSRHQFYQTVAKVRSDSIGRWRTELSSEQLQQVNQEAGELLHTLNYSN
ncbi:MAG: sulfotransferase [Cyanobacteria bacterium P01_D01_bin.56]